MPLLERVRVEVYLPDPHLTAYDNLLRSLEEEFTYAFGGCTIVRGLQGSYLSQIGECIPDQINLIYSDLSLALSTDFPLEYWLSLKKTPKALANFSPGLERSDNPGTIVHPMF